MLSITAKQYKLRLDKEKIKYEVHEDDNGISQSWTLKNGVDSCKILTFFDDDNRGVSIYGINFLHIPEGKWADGVIVSNKLNDDYRWIKFIVDKNDDIIMACDAIIGINNAADVVSTLVGKMLDIGNDAAEKYHNAFNAKE